MKQQRFSKCQTDKDIWTRLTLFFACTLCLLKCDTAYCKMQQTNPDGDPFAELERENPELFKPTISSKSKDQSYIYLNDSNRPNTQTETNQFTEVKHGRSSKADSTSQHRNSSQSAIDSHEGAIEQLIQSFVERKRPIFPERSKPGELISSCCSDPYMSSALENYLESQLNRFNSDDWDHLTFTDLSKQLNQYLPTFLNVSKLDDEGIAVDSRIDGKAIPPGMLRTRLQDVLSSHKLTYILRKGRLEITTETDVEDGEGVIRIYDVTPLVSNVRDGIEQLGGTITATIAPDSWIQNGGSSVLQFHVVPGEKEAITTVVITCPSTTHARVQDLLDRLNILAGSSSRVANKLPAVPAPTRITPSSGFPSQF